ncbi:MULTISPECIES: polysaccharide ABC transporter ATP-binding protein [unclassified Flavobacterium]|uniref:ABC transporter ATP-binding protein n=1 Tax=unclassified Flavobacterium TaxID=196869 RepID=UPI0005551E15|nr:ABC transporter ATP-binding protein [Flavobacterium sp. ASV13]
MEDNEVLVKVEHLSKKFCKDLKTSLWYGLKDLYANVLGNKNDNSELRKKEFWAVKDINFELRRGECLGLIGHNGAGKSTLLKILNGLINPDLGKVTMRGRVCALIELGAGFNPILTGRENIYNNGAVLGFSKNEINSKIEEIIDFAEIREFIDMPVQNYSSGMKVRLGFAVAAQMEPDVLIIDEVLAVGDVGFMLKCFNRIDVLLKNTAILFVSHSMPQVSRMVNQVLLLHKGQTALQTYDVAAGITEYYNQFKVDISKDFKTDKVLIQDLKIYSDGVCHENNDSIIVSENAKFEIEISLHFYELVKNPSVYIALYDGSQRGFAEISNFNDFIKYDEVQGEMKVVFSLDNLPLSQGKYSISIGIMHLKDNVRNTLARFQSVIAFTINSENHGWVPVQFKPEWRKIK